MTIALFCVSKTMPFLHVPQYHSTTVPVPVRQYHSTTPDYALPTHTTVPQHQYQCNSTTTERLCPTPTCVRYRTTVKCIPESKDYAHAPPIRHCAALERQCIPKPKDHALLLCGPLSHTGFAPTTLLTKYVQCSIL